MNLYLVIIELENTSNNDNLILSSVFRNLGKYLPLTEHAYVVRSEAEKASMVRDSFMNAPIDVKRIYVSKCTSAAAWINILTDNTTLKALLNGEE